MMQNEISQDEMTRLTELIEDRRDLVLAHEREKTIIGFQHMSLTQKLIVIRQHKAAMDAINKSIEKIMQGDA